MLSQEAESEAILAHFKEPEEFLELQQDSTNDKRLA